MWFNSNGVLTNRSMGVGCGFNESEDSCCGLLCNVVGGYRVSKEILASIFRIEEIWRQDVPVQRWYRRTRAHGSPLTPPDVRLLMGARLDTSQCYITKYM
jgi:hypothetical protein